MPGYIALIKNNKHNNDTEETMNNIYGVNRNKRIISMTAFRVMYVCCRVISALGRGIYLCCGIALVLAVAIACFLPGIIKDYWAEGGDYNE